MKDEIRQIDELELLLKDVTATEKLGAALGSELSDGAVIYLTGELGAGKTSLVRGVLRGLGHPGAVKSPTYTLLEEYSLDAKKIIHFDLYRLADPEELDLIGIRDYFNDKNICFIEWPEHGSGYLARQDLQIDILHQGDSRIARLSAFNEGALKMLKGLREAAIL